MSVTNPAVAAGPANIDTVPATAQETPWPFPVKNDGDDRAFKLHEELGFDILDAKGAPLMFGDTVKDGHGMFEGYIESVIRMDTGMVRLNLKGPKDTGDFTIDANMTLFVSRPEISVFGLMETPSYWFGDKIKDTYCGLVGRVVQIEWPASGCITYVCKRKIGEREAKKAGKAINPWVIIPEHHSELVKHAGRKHQSFLCRPLNIEGPFHPEAGVSSAPTPSPAPAVRPNLHSPKVPGPAPEFRKEMKPLRGPN